MTVSTTTGPLLSVRDLRVRSGQAEILHGLDLDIAPGERVGLIGESGSGKSLTCLSVMGLLPGNLTPSGEVRLAGTPGNLLATPEKDMARLRGSRLSMVFQEPMTALNPLQQVGHQVAEVMVIDGRAGKGVDVATRVVELLDSVGIPDPARAAKAYPHQLSGGQRQRVMLAMAMANTPDLLFADEPTTALDVTVQKQVLDLMRRQVTDAGSSLLFITHDLAIVADVCERVVILRHGSVVEQGPLDRVFSAPEAPYTRALLAASTLETDPASGRLVTLVDLAPASREIPPAAPVVRAAEDAGSHDQAPSFEAPHEVIPEGHEGSWVFNRTPAIVASPPLVVATEVERTYLRAGRRSAPVQALRKVSFDVRPGQHFGIVGESGCGKSTLLRILTGLDRGAEGSVRIDGQEIVGVPERRLGWLRKQVQIVFQDPMGSLDPRMRIEDIVAEPLRGLSRDERRERVGRLLTDVGLPASAMDRYPHLFSGGQRQRIAIARALVGSPSILVADEAVSALDVSVRAQVLNLLSDLVDEYGLTLVFVSHDLHVVRYVCDTVAVMNQGRIVECGPTDAVYDDPIHPYTRSLVAAVPTLEVA
ncbi:dipeptide ABC transporter ATP-binding protein [Brooklawnia cerclae]|uniref:ABC-type glutathione transport system ATPase component n=1 Tax=Brooklawnia cerclae TaxID=349934 RepID=A0ABX0SFE8_9ACTN|nr:ABC transporter ATP-binding protein [Brooklawnia cerclae]NIH57102.1 ABC-type glutathione transport system ATPase component [Brooklawnia cerclae]